MITCIDCGEEVERTGRSQKRCPKCAKEAQRGYEIKHKEKKRAERLANPVTSTIMCIDCGAEVERTGPGHRRCTDCANVATRERKARARARNREAQREYDAAYRAANRQVIRDRNAKWRSENLEYDSERHERHYSENRQALLDRSREWKAENPHLVREQQRREHFRDAAISIDRDYSSWTPAEDAVVMTWTNGLRELGATLGRTRAAVRSRRSILRERADDQSASSEGGRP